MFLALAKVVLPTAIIVFFLQEFKQLFKKLMRRKSLKLILPLLAVSFLVLCFEERLASILESTKDLLSISVHWLAKIFPHKLSWFFSSFLLMLSLMLLSIGLMERRKYNRVYVVYRYDWMIHLMLWLLLAILIAAVSTP